jgi:hypothetical protein
MNTSKQDRVSMVMERTMWNLEFIDKHKQETGPYEVTQLVNSFLGALAHPWEELQAEFKRRTIEEAEKDGWPKVSKDSPEDVDPKHLGDLLRLMRNGIAHGNIQFLPEGDCEIEFIRIVNIDPRCGHRTWGTVLKKQDMRQFLDKFVETARKLKTAEKPA